MFFKGLIETLSLLTIFLIVPVELYSHKAKDMGCHYNGTWYANKSLVLTTEKCLNCQCSENTLVCRLKICPEMPIPPPRGCVLVQKKNTCCPYLSCNRFDTIYKVPITRRIIAYLDQYERESIDRVINENILQGRSDNNEVDLYVCVKNGTVYKSGSAMSSSNLCSYCYCIGGTEKCVRPKCMLPVSGCKPIFVDSTCCPVRYDCSSKSTGKSSHEMRYRKTSNKHYLRISQRLQRNRGCTVNHNYYPEGHKMKSDPDKPCNICFCIRGQRKCAPKKCSPALKSCVPVIPKGQCCPSSYDCGYYGRASNSRQFNLFSLLFGKEDDQNFNDTELSVEYPSDRIPMEFKPDTTTERSILDALRKGLEFIDNNRHNIKNDMNFNELKSATTLKALILNGNISTSTEVNFVNSAKSNLNVSNQNLINIRNITSKENVASESLAARLNEKISIQSTTNISNDTEQLNRVNQDNSSQPILTTTFTDDLINNFDNVTTIDDLISITTDSYTTDDSTKDNLSETTMFSTTINDLEIIERIDVLNETSQKIKQLLNSTSLNAENQKETIIVLNSIKNELSSIKPEKKADFLDVLLNGLSDIFGGEKLKTNASTFISTELNEKLSTQKSTLPPFKPLPNQEKVPVRINSKIANLTFNLSTNVIKDGQNAQIVKNATKSKPNLIGLSEIPETFASISTSAVKNLNTSDKVSFAFDVISAPIKMNPTILDAELFEDVYKPTLPPSLPNLKIIPFLPTDAVKGDHHHKFYHQNPTVNARIDYNLYDDGNIYPSITEKYPLYNNLEDDSKAEYIYKFNVEGPDTLLSDIQASGGGVGIEQSSKGFSPPTKTEGGFIPKEPLLLNNKADNVDTINANVQDNYHLAPLLIDITTAYTINTSKVIDIITPDPFKDVIKTESPPNLILLIEDKKNNLLLTSSPIPPAEKSYALPTVIEVNLTNTQPTDKKHIIPEKLETEIGLVINVQPTPILTNLTQNYSIKEEDDEEEKKETINGMMVKLSNIPTHNIQQAIPPLLELKDNITKTTETLKEPQRLTTSFMSNQKDMERRSGSINATSLTHKTNSNKMTRITTKTKASNKSSKTKNSDMLMTTPMTATSASTLASISLATITMRPVMNVTRRIVNLKPTKINRNRTVPLIKKQTLAGLMTMQLPSSTSRVTTNTNPQIYINQNRTKQNVNAVTYLSEQSPFYNASFSLDGNSIKTPIENISSKFDNLNFNRHVPLISTERILNHAGQLTSSYDVISPKPYPAPVITTQRIEQHHYTSYNNMIDPAGILKLAGCNIYGRMYRVGRIIVELSNPCLECRCTEIGVKCNPLVC